MLKRFFRLAGAGALAWGSLATVAQAASPPPPPTSTNGNPVQLVASGLNTPTSFAFGAGQVFEGDGGAESSKVPNGGIYVLKGGAATKLANSPQFVGGLAWHGSTLYVSAGYITKAGPKFQVLAWSGWNGTKFSSEKAVYTAPKGFDGFNGIAYAPNGQLLVGVDLGLTDGNDHGPATTSPMVYDVLSMKPNGKHVKVFASGMRQPWQIAFTKGSNAPLISDLGQDAPAGSNAPDFLLRVHQGDNFGFPKCNQTSASACKGFTKPFQQFTPHTDIMGLAPVGKTLYMTSFLGPKGKGPGGEVLSMPVAGGTPKPLLTGFVAPTVGLGTDGTYVYVGELTGQVFRVKVK
jgi:glucose/arabinose dehydrogenase